MDALPHAGQQAHRANMTVDCLVPDPELATDSSGERLRSGDERVSEETCGRSAWTVPWWIVPK